VYSQIPNHNCCNGQIPFPGYISPSEIAFATAATAITTAPLQFTNCRCNGNQRHRWKPLQRLITLSMLYFTLKIAFAMAPIVVAMAKYLLLAIFILQKQLS